MKKFLILGMAAAMVLSTAACSATDVVAKYAKTSFTALVDGNPEMVSYDEGVEHWILETEEKEQFRFSKDFSQNNTDAAIVLKGKSFIDAGLDVNKLSESEFLYDPVTDELVLLFELGEEKLGGESASETFAKIVEQKRDLIDYHASADHYNISLPNGNKFEWAKDMSNNDKDIVFVLNPQPFIDAGVNPEQVEGWIFTKMEVEGKKGEEVDLFLKPLDLK